MSRGTENSGAMSSARLNVIALIHSVGRSGLSPAALKSSIGRHQVKLIRLEDEAGVSHRFRSPR
jgi:hypothetical protein